MKKLFTVSAIILVVLSLAACDPAHYYYDYEDLKSDVISIELINYNNPDVKELFEKRDKVISFDIEKMEIMETLSDESFNDFLLYFSKILFLEYWRHADSPNGTCVRIVYEDGDFEIVTHEVVYAGRFDAEGNVKKFIGGLSGKASFVSLVNNFFETKIT